MHPEQFSRVERLFEQASELPTSERESFVRAEASDDLEVLEELLNLIGADHEVRTVDLGFEDPIREMRDELSASSSTPEKTLEIPDGIGPYKILSGIGEGGMGVVYLAEQDKPVRRKVALKVIRPGMGSRAILARFDAERQALALMNHPTIASVYEAGTTDGGQPYFAMEYIEGQPLTTYCERRKLSLRERLSLFIEVCHGIQHAHQKAVIHRDLKPSNVLVTEIEGKPVPKIIDFGLAKAFGQPLTEQSLFTEQGTLLGTPAYMSPEQMDSTALGLDTRTDVYSLGVILYEILTDSLPFETEDLREVAQVAALVALRERICEQEPEKPSARANRARATRADATEAGLPGRSSLSRRLRGDLDWITMKALEKDRARRYASATELAGDLERHLNHEPVSAGPPSASYRLRKFVRKNSGLVASVSALFLLLCVGVVVTLLFYFEAEEKRIDAGKATLREAAAKEKEAEQRRLAEENEKEAVAAKEEVLLLADIRRLEELLADAEELWPAEPDRIGDFEVWMSRAEELAGNLERHRTTREVLRESATERPDPDSSVNPAISGWGFADAESRWQHEVLSDVVVGLEALIDPDPKVGMIANVRERVEFAQTVRKRSLEDHDVEWEDAIASISSPESCPAYNGLEIKPQLGLVPIGQDPGSGLWEFAHLQTGRIPDRDEEDRIVLAPDVGLVFVLLPGGEFWMGAQRVDPEKPNYDPIALTEESPVHRVSLAPFFIAKYETTQAQWERWMGRNPSLYGVPYYPSDYDRASVATQARRRGLHPVERVRWEDCAEGARRLGFAIPTEAQWEYAARAGAESVFWTGNDVLSLDGAANLCDRFAKGTAEGNMFRTFDDLDDGYAVHAPVGRYRANGFGLHDVAGNVWEWCRESFRDYTREVAPGDGERGGAHYDYRVCRGGSYASLPHMLRTSYRLWVQPGAVQEFFGVRFSRAVEK